MFEKWLANRQFQPILSWVFSVIGFLALMLAPAKADIVNNLSDGQRIVVTVDRHKIESVVFTDIGIRAEKEAPAGRVSQFSVEKRRSSGSLLHVGPKRELKYTSDAVRVAKDGDIMELGAKAHHNDYASWQQNDLTIRAVGGMAHLQSKGLIPNRQAIWIVNGNSVSIDNIEFSGASVKDTNGARIRHQGGNLKLRSTFFHDNEFSILSGSLPNAHIEIDSSRFWFQKRPQRHSHGIYIGLARRLTLVGNHFKGTDQGRQVKSRALENHILYNRIEDASGGNSSRLIDLSNCGLSFVVGNDLHQAATSANLNAIGYGPEGCEKRNGRQMALYVINNTFINEADGGAFVRNFAGGDASVKNNLVFGRSEFLVGKGTES